MSLLLDTCAVIWVAEGASIAQAATHALTQTLEAGEGVFMSPMSAWEIGLLVARGRLAMSMEPKLWLAKFMAHPGLRWADPSAPLLIDSSFLPGEPPRDPVDRIVIATARASDLTIMTRDRLILDYASAGHVKALAC